MMFEYFHNYYYYIYYSKFTFSSNTNTSHRAVRQHSSRHSSRSRCSVESINLAPNFFESSVRIILSSCTSNLFAQSDGAATPQCFTVANAVSKHQENRHQTLAVAICRESARVRIHERQRHEETTGILEQQFTVRVPYAVRY